MVVDSLRVYDSEEIYTDCTVQILHNSITGEASLGWSINPEIKPGKWRSVDEKPEPEECYLVLWKFNEPTLPSEMDIYYAIVWFDKYGWHTDEDIPQADELGGAEVLFWMPLPEKQRIM